MLDVHGAAQEMRALTRISMHLSGNLSDSTPVASGRSVVGQVLAKAHGHGDLPREATDMVGIDAYDVLPTRAGGLQRSLPVAKGLGDFLL